MGGGVWGATHKFLHIPLSKRIMQKTDFKYMSIATVFVTDDEHGGSMSGVQEGGQDPGGDKGEEVPGQPLAA